MENLYKGLGEIQSLLNAPKNRTNDFGKYNYRSCEDILLAVKPLLSERGMVLTIHDEIVEISNRVYVKAIATLYGTIGDKTESISVTAFAREGDERKKMDLAQLTGATSSYARKYALNGMFLIDDNKDFDTNEYHKEQEAREKFEDEKQERADMLSTIRGWINNKQITNTEVNAMMKQLFNADKFSQLETKQARQLFKELSHGISQRENN